MAHKLRFNFRFKPLRKAWRATAKYLPEMNFITLHYCYFIFTSLITGIIFWGSSTPSQSVRFIDAVFLTTSAMTEAGLNTVNLSTLNTWQQIILFLLIMMGSAIFVSAWVVHIRRKAFEIRFKDEIEKELRLSGRSSWFPLSRTLTRQQSHSLPPDIGIIRRTIPDKEDQPTRQSFTRADDSALRTKSLDKGSTHDQESPDGAITPNHMEKQLEEDTTPKQSPPPAPVAAERITFESDLRSPARREERDAANAIRSTSSHIIRSLLTPRGVGARKPVPGRRLSIASTHPLPPIREPTFPRTITSETTTKRDAFLPDSGQILRNSKFHALTEADRRRLGGTEYRAVVFLSWLVPIYFVIWQLLSCLALGAYVNNYWASTAAVNGLNPWWVGAFNAVSAFNNSGMSLLDANMTAFSTAIFMLLVVGLLILAGNTCYPVFLRLIVWIILKIIPAHNEDWSDARVTLQFLLDHPRRCYTNLFPSSHTWWLFFSVVLLNGIDCAAFVILNIGNSAITSLSPGIEFIDGLFQAFAVRSGGFYVVAIPSVRISLQVLYVIMMYISAFPVAITIRNSNVYEERSLGIFADDPGYAAELEKLTESNTGPLGFIRRNLVARYLGTGHATGQFVQQQLRAQLAHDIWLLVLAIFLIMIIEGSSFESNPTVFSVFNVIFEVVSAYGCVGISVGLPDQAYSFCGAWHTLSKLILCAVMIRGRHRGLPVAIDKAVLLPREHDLEEQEDQLRRMERVQSMPVIARGDEA